MQNCELLCHYAIPAVTGVYRHSTILRYCRYMHLQYSTHFNPLLLSATQMHFFSDQLGEDSISTCKTVESYLTGTSSNFLLSEHLKLTTPTLSPCPRTFTHAFKHSTPSHVCTYIRRCVDNYVYICVIYVHAYIKGTL